MSRSATTAFQAPVADRGADLWEAFHHKMQPMTDGDHFAKATFSGGCFWCLQPPFDTLDGVVATVVGYTGGRKTHPAYEDVAAGRTGHALAVQVLYDPRRLPYPFFFTSLPLGVTEAAGDHPVSSAVGAVWDCKIDPEAAENDGTGDTLVLSESKNELSGNGWAVERAGEAALEGDSGGEK